MEYVNVIMDLLEIIVKNWIVVQNILENVVIFVDVLATVLVTVFATRTIIHVIVFIHGLAKIAAYLLVKLNAITMDVAITGPASVLKDGLVLTALHHHRHVLQIVRRMVNVAEGFATATAAFKEKIAVCL